MGHEDVLLIVNALLKIGFAISVAIIGHAFITAVAGRNL